LEPLIQFGAEINGSWKGGNRAGTQAEGACKQTVTIASTNNVTALAFLRSSQQGPKVSEPSWLPEIVKVESLWDSIFVVTDFELSRGFRGSRFALLLAQCTLLGFFRLLLLAGALFLTLGEGRTRISCHDPPKKMFVSCILDEVSSTLVANQQSLGWS
jgi:hypothetical protein